MSSPSPIPISLSPHPSPSLYFYFLSLPSPPISQADAKGHGQRCTGQRLSEWRHYEQAVSAMMTAVNPNATEGGGGKGDGTTYGIGSSKSASSSAAEAGSSAEGELQSPYGAGSAGGRRGSEGLEAGSRTRASGLLDLRGNHDCFAVPHRGSRQDLFSLHSATAMWHGSQGATHLVLRPPGDLLGPGEAGGEKGRQGKDGDV